MSNPTGFLQYERKDNPYRKVAERIFDFEELQVPLDFSERKKQAARCMNCGIPFCHQGIFYGGKRAVSGCPNDNLIPEWQDFLERGDVLNAFRRLSKTNPLPEMTGRVCPAPCEASCTENLNGAGVTIHDNERFIIDMAFKNGWVEEFGRPVAKNNFKIAIVGSGPAGLACAWRLNQLGAQVTIFEKADRFGGLLMYGIPNMKLDKKQVKQRIEIMKRLGIRFVANTEVGRDLAASELIADFDRVILTIGAQIPRDLVVKGRELAGISLAVDFLTAITKEHLTKQTLSQKLKGKKVVVIGGGDTGNDCIGAAIRLGAKSVQQLEITPRNGLARASNNPWPEYPLVAKDGYGQIEAKFLMGKDITAYETTTLAFLGNEKGQLTGLEVAQVDEKFQPLLATKQIIAADIAILAMGFLGADKSLLTKFQVEEIFDNFKTNNDKVYVAGDAKRGPSLVIWAIFEGRKVAEKVDQDLRAMLEIN